MAKLMNNQARLLFIDGSCNPVSKVGYGAYLFLNSLDNNEINLINKVVTKRFVETSSVELELLTMLWAINEITPAKYPLTVYTDSQNIMKLPSRRQRLERNNFVTNSGTLIANHSLYRSFYKVSDQFRINLVKVKGHQPSKNKTDVEKLFTLVDKASRMALRNATI